MKLLLDTHTLLWLVEANPKLSTNAQTLLRNPGNELFLSVASIWELAIKISRKRLTLSMSLHDYMDTYLPQYGIRTIPISRPHAEEVATLPDHHWDPFDRLLIAQA